MQYFLSLFQIDNDMKWKKTSSTIEFECDAFKYHLRMKMYQYCFSTHNISFNCFKKN